MKALSLYVIVLSVSSLFGCNSQSKELLDTLLKNLETWQVISLYKQIEQIDSKRLIWVENGAYGECRKLLQAESDDFPGNSFQDSYDQISNNKQEQIKKYTAASIYISNHAIKELLHISVFGKDQSIKTDAAIAYLLTQKSKYIS